MRRLLWAFMACALLFSLTGCALTPPADNSLPGRMVAAIHISMRPYDETMERDYTNKDSLGPIIRMLRDMDTGETAEELPETDLAQDACTITATYANGSSEVYCILEQQYLRKGEGEWHTIDPERFNEFQQYVRDTISDQ